MGIRHKKSSAKPDGNDPGQVQPSDWDDEHAVDGVLGALLPMAATPDTIPRIDSDGNGAAVPTTAIGLQLLSILSFDALRVALAAASIDSPIFTGEPRAPTPALLDNSTLVATTEYVQAAISTLIDGSPELLQTLNGIAQAIGDDPNFAATITEAVGNRLRIDAAQGLSAEQKATALANLGVVLGVAANNVLLLNASGKAPSSILDTGTGANKIVQLDANGKLPAVDGSQLSNITPGSGALRYDQVQTLNASQQTQARSNAGLGDMAVKNMSGTFSFGGVSVGTTNSQYGLLLSCRGSGLEFGHGNTAGYGGSLMAESGTGIPFLGFQVGPGTNANSYKTLGFAGSVFRGDKNGGFIWATVPNANADNQTLTTLMSLSGSALLTLAGSFSCPGTAAFGDVLTANNGATLGGGVTISGGVQVGGVATFTNQIKVTGGGMNVTGTAGITGNMSVTGTLSVGGSFVLTTNSFATTAEILSNSGTDPVNVAGLWAAAATVQLSISGSYTLNANTGCNFRFNLVGNTVFNLPSNLTDGQVFNLSFIQDATGGRTLSWGSSIQWPDNTPPVVVTTAQRLALYVTAIYTGGLFYCTGWSIY